MRRITKRIFCTALALSMALPQSVPVFAAEEEPTAAQDSGQNEVQSGESVADQIVNLSAEQSGEQTDQTSGQSAESGNITDIVINEIESNGDTKDWVEIYNKGDKPVDISGWYVLDNDSKHTKNDVTPIENNKILQPGEFYVLEEEKDFTFGLGKEDKVNLYTGNDKLVADFSWSAHASGVLARVPDGTGEMKDVATSTKGASNNNADQGATPDSGQTTDPDQTTKPEQPADAGNEKNIVINEIESNGDVKDWVEIYNKGDKPVDISGWYVLDNDPEHTKSNVAPIENNKILQPGEFYVFEEEKDFTFGLGKDDKVNLYTGNDQLVEEFSWSAHASGVFARVPDGTGEMKDVATSTKGASNNDANQGATPDPAPAPGTGNKANIVINEIESNGDTTDWVEIYNKGTEAVDISGWYILDDDPGHKSKVVQLKENTILQPGTFYVFDQKIDFDFGLGAPDEVNLYTNDDTLVEKFSWSNHANGVLARVPDGTGALTEVAASTKGTSNNDAVVTTKPEYKGAVDWPGSDKVITFDDGKTMFKTDSSGLDFYNGKLYCINNKQGTFWVMDVKKDGSLDYADGFTQVGKNLAFAYDSANPSASNPDAEGITVDGNGLAYAAVERDNNKKDVNANWILQFDPWAAGTTVVASKEWNITDLLPDVAANAGIESVEWVSNADVAGKLFDETTGAAFDPKNYPDAVASGIFFVALENNGHVYAFVLNKDGSAKKIADIDPGIGGAMALDYDKYENYLWVGADDGYGNISAKIKLNGTKSPEVTLVNPPKGMDVTRNNEGFAIAEQEFTVNGLRPVYHFMDGQDSGVLTISYMNCDYKTSGSGTETGDGNQGSGSGTETGNGSQGSGSGTETGNGQQGTNTGSNTGNTSETTEKHSWSTWKTIYKATVFTPEIQKHTCSICGASEVRENGTALAPAMELKADTVPLKLKQKVTKDFVTGLANGDYVTSWKSSNTKIVKVTGKKDGTCTLTAQNKTGSAKITVSLASGYTKTFTVKVQKNTVTTTKITGVNGKATLNKGKTLQLKPVLTPVTSVNKITYSSSNKKVATVSSSGKITAKAPGTAKITVKSGKKKVTCTVTVPGITGVKSSLKLTKGRKVTLKPKTYGSSEKVTFTSSNTKVATVSSKGQITAKAAGTAKVTVKSGNLTVTCTVTVPGITGVNSSLTVAKGKIVTLNPKAYGISGKLIFASLNRKVATVSTKGKITAKQKGTTVITVIGGYYSVKCKVTVK